MGGQACLFSKWEIELLRTTSWNESWKLSISMCGWECLLRLCSTMPCMCQNLLLVSAPQNIVYVIPHRQRAWNFTDPWPYFARCRKVKGRLWDTLKFSCWNPHLVHRCHVWTAQSRKLCVLRFSQDPCTEPIPKLCLQEVAWESPWAFLSNLLTGDQLQRHLCPMSTDQWETWESSSHS